MTLITSCEKEEVSSLITDASIQEQQVNTIKINSSNDSELENSVNEARAVRENETTYYDNGGDDYGCSGSPSDCDTPVIIIGSAHFNIIDNLFQVAGESNSSNIREYIESNFDILSQFIAADDLNQVLSGQLTLSVKPYNLERERFLLFSSERSIVYIYPFK